MRKNSRFLSNAVVYVEDKNKNELKANLRDVSIKGLSIESDEFIDIEPNSHYKIEIVPEDNTKNYKILLEVQSRWVKLVKTKMESGFSVKAPSGKTEYKEFIENLAEKDKTAMPPDEDGDGE